MLLVKFVFQFPYFCVCGNAYSHGSHCPSSLPAYADVCPVDQTPRLDYFINQPVVHDYAIGVYKAFRALPWNQMSLRYEPVDRFVPSTPPGQVRLSHTKRCHVPLSTYPPNQSCLYGQSQEIWGCVFDRRRRTSCWTLGYSGRCWCRCWAT